MQGKFFDFRNFAIRSSGKTGFATSGTYNGNLGGLAGADAKCQERADDAGLPGTYKAWLSGSTRINSVSNRFDREFDHVPIFRTDGVRIANNWGDLTDGTLLAPIDRDEFGHTTGEVDRVWTNTRTAGNHYGNDPALACNDWTSTASSRGNYNSYIGEVTAINARWTERGNIFSCENQYRLYCFQQVSFGPNPNDSSPHFPTHCTTQTFLLLLWGT